MSKKTFTGGLNSLLREALDPTVEELKELAKDRKPGPGRPRSNFKEVTKSSQQGTKVGEVRGTFILREDLLDKLKAIAYWDRVLIKEVVNNALQETIAKWEKRNGTVKPLPTEKKDK